MMLFILAARWEVAIANENDFHLQLKGKVTPFLTQRKRPYRNQQVNQYLIK
jgi:hypothetical protein